MSFEKLKLGFSGVPRSHWALKTSSPRLLYLICILLSIVLLSIQAVQLKGCRSISFRIIDSLKKKGILVDVLSMKSRLERAEPPLQV